MIKVLLFAALCAVVSAQYGHFILGHTSYRPHRPLTHLGGHAYNQHYGGHGNNQHHGGHYGGLRQSRGYPDHHSSNYGHADHGYAPIHDSYSQPIPYDFGYDVHGDHGDQQHRRESGDGHGNVRGSYGYRDSYGLYRHVDYVADHHGFRANVKTNEPGTANQNPADVHIQSEQHGHHYGRHY